VANRKNQCSVSVLKSPVGVVIPRIECIVTAEVVRLSPRQRSVQDQALRVSLLTFHLKTLIAAAGLIALVVGIYQVPDVTEKLAGCKRSGTWESRVVIPAIEHVPAGVSYVRHGYAYVATELVLNREIPLIDGVGGILAIHSKSRRIQGASDTVQDYPPLAESRIRRQIAVGQS
jgi:hypothetical protein